MDNTDWQELEEMIDWDSIDSAETLHLRLFHQFAGDGDPRWLQETRAHKLRELVPVAYTGANYVIVEQQSALRVVVALGYTERGDDMLYRAADGSYYPGDPALRLGSLLVEGGTISGSQQVAAGWTSTTLTWPSPPGRWPTTAWDRRTSRSVMPAEFIRFAASRKNGTASRMKAL